MRKDDSDIKIFTKPEKKDEHSELSGIADVLGRHRETGNIDKANKLGEDLALMSVNKVVAIPYKDEINVAESEYALIQYQASILLIFSARHFLGEYLNETLIPIAMSALYNKLIDITPELFKNLSGGAEISFYTLALSRDGIPSKHIGNCFAMLCKHDADSKFVAYGEKLYNYMDDTILKMIKQENFCEV